MKQDTDSWKPSIHGMGQEGVLREEVHFVQTLYTILARGGPCPVALESEQM